MSTPQSVIGRLPKYPVPTPTVNCVLLQEMKKRGLLSWQYRKCKWGISTLSSRPGQTKDPAGSLYPESNLFFRDGDSMTRFKMPLLLQGRVEKVLWQLELAGGSTYTGVPSVPDLGH